jgi:mannose-6-phosphate isomerase-like protein (cupin superfamily)
LYYSPGFPGDGGFSMFDVMFVLVPLIIFGTIAFMIIKGLSTWTSNNAAPVRVEEVTVIGKRIQVWGGSNNSSANTSYFITFELSSGERLELAVKGQEYGVSKEDETGLLTFQGTRFKSFQPRATAARKMEQQQQAPHIQESFTPHKISKKSAEHYNWGAACDGWHLAKGDNLSVIHERMPGKTEEVRHYHERARQFFFVLSGEAMLEVDGVKLVLREQEGAEVPPGVWHQMKNERLDEVEFLVISTPPTRGDRIQEQA